MHDHFEEGDSGYPDVFEVVWVLFPRAGGHEVFLFGFIVVVQSISVGVNQFDGILKLYFSSVISQTSRS